VEKAKTRTQNQVAIEDSIVRFSPDYLEACEILDALMVGLESSYDEQDLKDAIECHRWYKEALNKADMKRSRAPDEMTEAKWDRLKKEEA
jgi:hypothetical protein